MSTTRYPDLDGKVALVTGAAGGGCGTGVALELAARGATVVVNGLPRHRAALARLVGRADRLQAAEADVSDESAVDRLVRDVVDRHGSLDIVVHNAAASLPRTPVADLATAAWRADLGVVLDAAFFLSRAASPHLRHAGWGRLVFISSSSAFRGARGRSAAYSAAKAGLHGLVAHLALELGPHGVTANAVAPSQVDTDRVRRGGRRDEDSLRRYAATVPAGRAGSPSDVAALVAFLASPASGYLTGQVLRLDGGSSLAAPDTEPLPREDAR